MDPISPISPVGAVRYLPPEAGGLTVGAVVKARVARVDGDVVQLRWGEQTVAVASRVPLAVGQQVNLLVEEGAAGKVLLKMVDDTFGRPRAGRPGGDSGAAVAQPGDGRADGSRAGVAGDTIGQVHGQAHGRAARPGSGPSGDPLGGPASASRRDAGPAPAQAGAQPSPSAASPSTPLAGRQGAGAVPRPGSPGDPGDGAAIPGRHAATASGAGVDGLLDMLARAEGHPSIARHAPDLPGAPPGAADGSAGARSRLGDPASAAGRRATDQAAAGPADRPPGPDAARAVEPPPLASLARLRGDVASYERLALAAEGPTRGAQVLVPTSAGPGLGRPAASFLMVDAPALLAQLGIAADELNAALVSQLVAQGAPLGELQVRGLRRALARIGGRPADAGAAVLLGRLGLPISEATLALARQLQAGRHDPAGAWREALAEIGRFASAPDDGAGPVAAEARALLARWTPPPPEDVPALARWLHASVVDAATPPEATVARAVADRGAADGLADGRPGERAPDGVPSDARSRLASLQQVVARGGGIEGTAVARALDRASGAVLAEQALNAAPAERAEPRFFAVTLPVVQGRDGGAIELRVRERAARGAGDDPDRPDVVRIALSLPTLGDLSISLTVGRPRIECRFDAASPFAQALLRASAGDLEARLARLGFPAPTISAGVAAEAPAAPEAAGAYVARRVKRVDVRA